LIRCIVSGAIAGFTFALANTRLIALSAIITGISATLSMAASNYLAERADGSTKAIKSAVYTGVAYLITVALMVLPFLLLPNGSHVWALVIMLTIVVLIILFFTYYVSVTQSEPFLPRFMEMATFSLGVAAISFAIGLVAKNLLHVDV
jgi:VIT1/CCC1 family predicted Fe2+/Mn2+ transporter